MSEAHDTTVMTWQPPLMRLTACPNPQISEGRPRTLFIIPQLISSIHEGISAQAKFLSNPTEWLEPFQCTLVTLSNGERFEVTESPSTVARMRDESLGHKWATTKLEAL